MNEETKISESDELAEALKEFEEKSKIEENQNSPQTSAVPEVPRMVKLVIKWSGGAIKDQRHAEYALLGFIVLAFAVSFYLFFG